MLSQSVVDETKMNFLSKDARKLLGVNHVVWENGYLGDMTEKKVELLNRYAAQGYSAGVAQQVGRFPTQMQEVILRLAIEKNLDKKQIVASTGLKNAMVHNAMSMGRALGFLPQGHLANDQLSVARRAYQARALQERIARKQARDNPQSVLPEVTKGARQSFQSKQADALMRAKAILSGQPLPPAQEPAPIAANGHLQQADTRTVITSPGIEKDPSKRVVEVTLQMTVEEIGDFYKALHASKEKPAE